MTQFPDGVADSLSAWRVALASLLLISVGMGIEYLLWSNVKTISDDMGRSRVTTAAAYALEMLGTGVGGILMGRWADKMGAAPVVLIGAMMIPSGVLALTNVTEAWQFCLIFGVMIGFIGNATLFAPLITTATCWFDRKRGLAVAIVASGQGLAGIIWPYVLDSLIALYGWRGATFIHGAFAMVVMPLVGSSAARQSAGLERHAGRTDQAPGCRLPGWRCFREPAARSPVCGDHVLLHRHGHVAGPRRLPCAGRTSVTPVRAAPSCWPGSWAHPSSPASVWDSWPTASAA